YLESSSPMHVADALLTAPRTDGQDVPEAHEDAIRFVHDALQTSQLQRATVVLFSDAPPHKPTDCPHGYDFDQELQRLLIEGHRIILVACGKEPSELGWGALQGSKAIRLDQHHAVDLIQECRNP